MANDDALKRLRPAPASVYLLAEHLDAALAAGEDLTGVLCLSSDTPPREEAELVEFRGARLGLVCIASMGGLSAIICRQRREPRLR